MNNQKTTITKMARLVWSISVLSAAVLLSAGSAQAAEQAVLDLSGGVQEITGEAAQKLLETLPPAYQSYTGNIALAHQKYFRSLLIGDSIGNGYVSIQCSAADIDYGHFRVSNIKIVAAAAHCSIEHLAENENFTPSQVSTFENASQLAAEANKIQVLLPVYEIHDVVQPDPCLHSRACN